MLALAIVSLRNPVRRTLRLYYRLFSKSVKIEARISKVEECYEERL